MGLRHWAVPFAAALAVFAVLLGTWSLVGPGEGARPRHSVPATRLPTPQPGGFIGGPPRTPVPSPSHRPRTSTR